MFVKYAKIILGEAVLNPIVLYYFVSTLAYGIMRCFVGKRIKNNDQGHIPYLGFHHIIHYMGSSLDWMTI